MSLPSDALIYISQSHVWGQGPPGCTGIRHPVGVVCAGNGKHSHGYSSSWDGWPICRMRRLPYFLAQLTFNRS